MSVYSPLTAGLQDGLLHLGLVNSEAQGAMRLVMHGRSSLLSFRLELTGRASFLYPSSLNLSSIHSIRTCITSKSVLSLRQFYPAA